MSEAKTPDGQALKEAAKKALEEMPEIKPENPKQNPIPIGLCD